MSIRELQNKAVANSLGLATLADITAGAVTSLDGLTGAVTLSSPDASISINNSGNNIEIQAVPVGVYQATYYNSVNQALTSGNTDITFDSLGSWNNPNGYITHTNGTAIFTVVQTGLYFLEINTNIQGTGVAWTGQKSVNIDITRSPVVDVAVLQQSATQNSGTDYGQSVSSTFYLVAGDVINCRVFNVYSSGTPYARGVQNTFDLNTFFTWRFIS